MQISKQIISSFLSLCALVSVTAASSWGFDDATVSVHGKKAGVGGGFKEKYALNPLQSLALLTDPWVLHRLIQYKALSKPVSLGASDTLKVLLTAKEDKTPKRPHQVFLLVKDYKSGLDTSYAFSVKESGKGKVELVSIHCRRYFCKN